MTKLAENNPQGTANIADDRVLATVIIKLIADYNNEIEMLKPVRKYYATKGDISFHVADTRIAAFERVVSDLEKATSNCG